MCSICLPCDPGVKQVVDRKPPSPCLPCKSGDVSGKFREHVMSKPFSSVSRAHSHASICPCTIDSGGNARHMGHAPNRIEQISELGGPDCAGRTWILIGKCSQNTPLLRDLFTGHAGHDGKVCGCVANVSCATAGSVPIIGHPSVSAFVMLGRGFGLAPVVNHD